MSFPKKERGVAVRLEKTVRDGCSPFSITVAKEGFDGGTLLVSFWNIRDGFGFGRWGKEQFSVSWRLVLLEDTGWPFVV